MKRSFRIFLLGIFLISLIGFTCSCGKDDPIIPDTPETETIPCDSLQLSMDYDPDAGTLTVIATGGNEPYSYVWLNDSTAATIEVDDDVSYYQVVVMDAEGCEQEVDYELEIEISCESFMVMLEYSELHGVMVVREQGGTAPYSYQWSGHGSGQWSGQEESHVHVYQAGIYGITLVDANGCTASGEYEVQEGNLQCSGFVGTFEWNANTWNLNSGVLSFEIGNGEDFFHEWSTGELGYCEPLCPSILVSELGEYSVYVFDGMVCSETFSTVITSNDPNPDCNQEVAMNASTNSVFNFQTKSEAYIFRSACTQDFPVDYDYNYLIVDANWDFDGTGQPNIALPSDGIPGFTFGSNGVPLVGQTYGQYALGNNETLFNTLDLGTYVLDDLQVTITESGYTFGSYIAGTLSGFILNKNDANDSATVTGDFCIPIVGICNDH